MNRVVHFEIPAEDPNKAMDFYEKTFGWKYQRFGEHEYWLAVTGDDEAPGINGAIMKKNHPQQPLTNSIAVADIKDTLKKIESNGGTVVVPVTAIPGVGWFAFFKDVDQNILGVMQDDNSAK